jgi:Transposase DDE domain group 1
VVLFREATAAIPETATAAVGTLRQRLWKVGAVVVTGARRIWLHVSETWPHRNLWVRVQQAVQAFVARLQGRPTTASAAVGATLL